MKKTIDGFEIPARIWYYILDYNDSNESVFIWQHFGVGSLKNCSKAQIAILFEKAGSIDLEKYLT